MYIVKWKKDTAAPYLVDAGASHAPPTWTALQLRARRFKTKEAAIRHVNQGFPDLATTWIANGSAKIVRLVPRKS